MPQSRESRSHRLRTLVTGGAGFLGSHLCDRFIAEGHEVICLDNLVTGSLDNVQHLLRNPHFTFLRHDMTRPVELALISSGGRNGSSGEYPLAKPLNFILHFASPASPKDYLRHPILTLQVGSFGTYHALELARRHGSVLLIASSSEVYGDPEVNLQPESYWGHVNPIGPRSVYDESKRFSEALTMAYHRKFAVETRIARIFNTYGERMRIQDGRVLPNFMVRTLRNRPVTIYGDGSQTRSFCYVSDMVDGIYRLLMSKETEPVNLGNPEEVTISDFAREVIELTGSRSRIVFRPLPVDDPRRRRPDTTKASSILGWRPKVGRRKGIQAVIPYFKAQLQVRAKSRRVQQST